MLELVSKVINMIFVFGYPFPGNLVAIMVSVLTTVSILCKYSSENCYIVMLGQTMVIRTPST